MVFKYPFPQPLLRRKHPKVSRAAGLLQVACRPPGAGIDESSWIAETGSRYYSKIAFLDIEVEPTEAARAARTGFRKKKISFSRFAMGVCEGGYQSGCSAIPPALWAGWFNQSLQPASLPGKGLSLLPINKHPLPAKYGPEGNRRCSGAFLATILRPRAPQPRHWCFPGYTCAISGTANL